MKTLISSIPLLRVPNRRGYSAGDISRKLAPLVSNVNEGDNSLQIRSAGGEGFLLKVSGRLEFYKVSPLFLQIVFALGIVGTALQFIYRVWSGPISGPVDVLLLLLVTCFVFCVIQLPEVAYYSSMANRHVESIDDVLHKLELQR